MVEKLNGGFQGSRIGFSIVPFEILQKTELLFFLLL